MSVPFDRHLPADAASIAQARQMLRTMRDAALAVLDDENWPMMSRVAVQTDTAGQPLALLSGLALHTAALTRDPRAALLIDAASTGAQRGTALSRARLSLQVMAQMADTAAAEAMRTAWIDRDPKAAVYLRLPDFRFWNLTIRGGLLNAGFGRACRIGPGDLG